MTKILGLPFDKYANNQITIRQDKLAKRQKAPEDLTVFNSNTSWVRLSSAVKIDAAKAAALSNELGIGVDKIMGTKLAQNLVLFGGTTPHPNGTQGALLGGVGYGLGNSYGFLTQTSQGLKPMPGITQISVTSKSNGSLKQCQVSIKCYSRTQFEAIEAVYLRLGYTMILEWGHSVYFDNEGTLQTASLPVMPTLLFSTDDNITPKQALDKVSAERLLRAGNYDAAVSRVSNYSWSLEKDLSYSIKLDLISVGDLIDSIKVNVGGSGTPGGITVGPYGQEGSENIITILANKNVSKINKFMYELFEYLFQPLITKYAPPEERVAVTEAVETSKLLTETRKLVQDRYLPFIDKLKQFTQIYLKAASVARDFNIAGQDLAKRNEPAASFTDYEKKVLQDLVDLLKSYENLIVNGSYGELIIGGSLRSLDEQSGYDFSKNSKPQKTLPKNPSEAYLFFFNKGAFLENETEGPKELIKNLDILQDFLLNPPPDTLKKPGTTKKYNDYIVYFSDPRNARTEISRILDDIGNIRESRRYFPAEDSLISYGEVMFKVPLKVLKTDLSHNFSQLISASFPFYEKTVIEQGKRTYYYRPIGFFQDLGQSWKWLSISNTPLY